jgi:hypothetical protein
MFHYKQGRIMNWTVGRRQGTVPLIGTRWVGFTWRRTQNPDSETLYVWNKNITVHNAKKHYNCTLHTVSESQLSATCAHTLSEYWRHIKFMLSHTVQKICSSVFLHRSHEAYNYTHFTTDSDIIKSQCIRYWRNWREIIFRQTPSVLLSHRWLVCS